MILLYRLFLLALTPVVLILGPLFSKKIRLGLKLRRQKLKQLPELSSCFWIHASSGEYEYARPVIQELKKRNPEVAIVVTYFSPSYAAAIENDTLVDHTLPLPLDLPGAVHSFIKRIKPKAVFFARTDLWPELVHQLHRKQIPTVLFSFYQKSNISPLSLFFKSWLLKKLSFIDCVDENTFKYVQTLNVSCAHSGDTRYDQVIQRARHLKGLPFTFNASGKTLVFGSTWPEDEKILIPVLKATEGLWSRVIFVPHENSESHMAALEEQFSKLQFTCQRLSQVSNRFESQILLVDQFGWLMSLYSLGYLAFVGGSFKGSVHSVMEPLAHGLPTLTGPYIKNNAEALEFQGLGFVKACANLEQFEHQLKSWLSDPPSKSKIGGEILKRAGASAKLLDQIQTLKIIS